MNSWKTLQTSVLSATSKVGSSVGNLDLSSTGNKLSRQFQTLGQQVREQTGQASLDDVTELPEEYKNLERRVDALRQAHVSFLKISKAYESETYDYPTQINESISELSQNAAHSITYWANAATKGTNLPQPTIAEKAPEQHKTLAHALSRASANGSAELGGGGQTDRLGAALSTFAAALDKVGNARLEQDHAIQKLFIAPWSAMLNSQIAAAMKSRAAVKSARLFLDTCRAKAKNATTGHRAESARIEVESAEESLVNATEDAINQMRAVLESPSPILALNHLVKAQQAYHAKAAGFLAAIEGQIEDAATAAEAEFRKSRA